MKQDYLLKSALYNLDDSNKADSMYCRGLVVGLISALMARGASYQTAIQAIRRNLPKNVNQNRVPPCYASDILD
jgi:hypothetical protein